MVRGSIRYLPPSALQEGHGLNLGLTNEAIKISAVPEWAKGKYVTTWYLF